MSSPCTPTTSNAFRGTGSAFRGLRSVKRSLLLLTVACFAACNDTGWPDRDPVIVEDPGADALLFHPPVDHALPGDVLPIAVQGLKTAYACAELLAFRDTMTDSLERTYVSVTARVRWPGIPECPLVTGKDTVLRITAPAAGRTVVVRTPGGIPTDSLTVFAGTGMVDGFSHDGGDTLSVHGRFTFRDSTAAHPRRVLYADTLAACAVIQAAVFTRLNGGDTLQIAYRTLIATPALPNTVLPACAGPHGDTVPVVENAYGLPGPAFSVRGPSPRPR